MSSPTDKVNVSFVYQGKIYEVATCERRIANEVGERMVKMYGEIFSGNYVIGEIDTSLASVTDIRKYRRKPNSKAEISAEPHAPHHYEIIV
jgi:hypothetical protein